MHRNNSSKNTDAIRLECSIAVGGKLLLDGSELLGLVLGRLHRELGQILRGHKQNEQPDDRDGFTFLVA